MSGALIGALRVTMGIDTAAFEQGLGIAQKNLAAAGKNLQSVGKSMSKMGASLSVAVTAPIVAFGVASVQAARESEAAMAQVNAALASMGPVAGKTSEQLQKAAADLQHLSTFDDDDILKSVTANMLTFGNITGETFDRAQLAVVNLSARMGTDLQSATVMIGKALNDPVKGLAALGRAGIQFSADQKEMIKSMVAAGDTAGAQAIMLGELEKQFGGAAKAARDATPGAALIDAWNNFKETIGAIVVKVLPPFTEKLASVLEAFNSFSPGTQSFIVAVAGVAAALGPVLVVLGTLASAVGSLLPIFAPVVALIGEAGIAGVLATAATAAAPFIAAAAALATGWALFGDKIGPVLSMLSEKLQSTLGPKMSALFDTVKASLNDLWAGPLGQAVRVVIDVLGDLGAAFTSIFGQAIISIVSALVEVVNSAFKVIGDVFRTVAALLRGDFSAAWTGIKSLVGNVIGGIIGVLKTLAPSAVAAVKAMAVGFATWFGDLAAKMIGYGRNIIDGLVKGILAAPEAVWNALKSVVFSGVDNIRKYLGIASPSRLFMEMGGFVTDGLAIGIENGISTVQTAMGNLADAVAIGLDQDSFERATAATGAAADDLGTQVKKTTEQVIKDFGDMAAGVVQTLGGMKDAIKNGDFFDIVLSVLDVVASVLDTIAQIKGISSGGVDASVKLAGRASGGPVLANMPYIVGERRAEVFVPSTSGRIEPNLNARRGGGDTINNYYGPGADEFWGKINSGHEAAARRGAAAGAQTAVQQLQRGRQRALA